jgi:hypothetical protein
MRESGYFVFFDRLGETVWHQGEPVILKQIRWRPGSASHKSTLLLDRKSGEMIAANLDEISA